MIKAAVAIALVATLVIGAPSKGRTQETLAFDFASAAEEILPDDFEAGMTGRWKPTEWRVRTIAGNRVLAHIGFWNEDPDGVFPVCWVRQSRARDLTLTVRLFPVRPPSEIAGAVHDGAGLVLRFTDPDNYYLLRVIPHEAQVRLYKVVRGKRTMLAGKARPVAAGEWHTLTLKAKGSLLTASFDGAELFSHADKTFNNSGAFGLWSKPNNVTYFDDLRAEIVK